ncbi:EAL domain-containing protein [Methylophilus methylotrophus]|uniref:bifunctional diguanylate cyclase/phosphodiesterase n=1 Tax=Methylophilus methylotrophus TaxID=17 RepID=UPI000F59AE70|nr:EAL domain-containing protein [Methylophilus methylotrophus]
MKMQEINIKKTLLRFIFIMMTSIAVTVGCLIWMTHQTYFSRGVITNTLIPNMEALNEIRTDTLMLIADVRESLRTQNLYEQNDVLPEILNKIHVLTNKVEQLKEQPALNPQNLALIEKIEQKYRLFNHELHHLLTQQPQDKSVAMVTPRFTPLFHAGKATIDSIDRALAANLLQTEEEFKALEYLEFTNIGIYLASMLLLLAGLYFYGKKTYKKIMAVLGSEPSEFISVINALLEGRQAPQQQVSENSLMYKLQQSLLFDKETGVLNKLGFLQQYPQSFKADQPVVANLIKMQSLEELSEFIGPASTTELLNQVMARLQEKVVSNSLIARVSYSSFLWVREECGDDKKLVAEIETLITRLQAPYSLGIRNIKIKIYAGIVKLPQDTENFKLLIPYTTLAATKAENTLQQYLFFAPGFLQESLDYIEMETALSHALENREFEVYLQPQVDIRDNRIAGAEALIRWKHPLKGFIPPDKFIPVAERNGQILDIGHWVLSQGISYAAEINQYRDDIIPISINLSSHQIQAPFFFDLLQYQLNHWQCHPTWIKLEITESALLERGEEVLKTLLQIASLGITISLDDFGTGYSSLSYLTKYPISQIKIDRSFMSDIPLHLDNTELVKAIIKLAEILHFEIVAEGIESLDQLNFLKKTSCAIVQGYYYFKPMPYAQFKLQLSEKQTANLV